MAKALQHLLRVLQVLMQGILAAAGSLYEYARRIAIELFAKLASHTAIACITASQ
jgi:hypothetical protein